MSLPSNTTLMSDYPNLLFAVLTMCVLLLVFSLWMYNQTAPLIAEYKLRHPELKEEKKDGFYQGPSYHSVESRNGFFGGMEAPVSYELNKELADAEITHRNNGSYDQSDKQTSYYFRDGPADEYGRTRKWYKCRPGEKSINNECVPSSGFGRRSGFTTPEEHLNKY